MFVHLVSTRPFTKSLLAQRTNDPRYGAAKSNAGMRTMLGRHPVYIKQCPLRWRSTLGLNESFCINCASHEIPTDKWVSTVDERTSPSVAAV